MLFVYSLNGVLQLNVYIKSSYFHIQRHSLAISPEVFMLIWLCNTIYHGQSVLESAAELLCLPDTHIREVHLDSLLVYYVETSLADLLVGDEILFVEGNWRIELPLRSYSSGLSPEYTGLERNIKACWAKLSWWSFSMVTPCFMIAVFDKPWWAGSNDAWAFNVPCLKCYEPEKPSHSHLECNIGLKSPLGDIPMQDF